MKRNIIYLALVIIVPITCVYININYIQEPDFIDPNLQPFYDRFKEDAKKHGISTWRLNLLDAVEYGDLDSLLPERPDLLGVYTGRRVYIHSELKDPKLFMTHQCVIWHELGHAIGLEHDTISTQQEIMSPTIFSQVWEQKHMFNNHRHRLMKNFWKYARKSLNNDTTTVNKEKSCCSRGITRAR